MFLNRTRTAAASALAAGGIALLSPGSPALAFISPPLVLLGEAQSPGHLVARGAAADVTVEYSCTAMSMYVNVRLTERVGRRVASGIGTTTVPCDGATHRVVVRVAADPAGAAFVRGRAVADTYVDGCRVDHNRYMCGRDTVTRTIRLTR